MSSIREQDPLKQGLKQCINSAPQKLTPIREQDPLKQGLKLGKSSRRSWRRLPIREQDPLKQGLKQIWRTSSALYRPYS